MEDTYLQHEDRIQRALKHLSTKASYNLSAVARMFGVDLQRLHRRIKGINSRSTRPKVNQKLNSYQIKALELYIHRLDLIGQPPLLSMVRDAAESIRIATTPPAERDALTPLGRDYIKRFVTTHPRMKKIRQK
ncbi:hypothetical protein K469DRAFT_610511, partial [Zopfia rhizophila CBS 207.26]